MNDDYDQVAAGTPVDDSPAAGRVLDHAGRQALIALMSRGSIYRRVAPEAFDALERHRARIEEVLTEMELRLLFDPDLGIAATASASELDEDETEGRTLIRRRRLTLYDTFVALILRKHYRNAEAKGESHVTIELDHIREELVPLLPLGNSEAKGDRALSGAIDRLKEMNLVAAVRGDDGRVEITPVIRLVVDAEWMGQLLAEYHDLARRKEAGADE